MNFKQVIQDYFTFSRNERKGIILLVSFIFLLGVANKIIFYFETPAKIDPQFLDFATKENDLHTNDSVNVGVRHRSLFGFNPNTINREGLDSLALPESVKRNLLKYREKGGRYYAVRDFKKMYGVTDSIFREIEPFLIVEEVKKKEKLPPKELKIQTELFNFDPNTASDNDFLRLGLTERQVQTIRNYQGKGGHFWRQADFLKIYSLSKSQKEALAPYVAIAETGKRVAYHQDDLPPVQIEINGTDSIELMTLQGIGPTLSKRIVKYRDLLGGFYSVEQLREVYGLREPTLQRIGGLILVDPSKVRKVDLNFADWKELARHPYIQKALAEKIVKFRSRFGSINEPEVLRDQRVLTPGEYERLKPYL